MSTRTRAQLVSEVRDRSDLADSQFRTDAQITRYLNSSNRRLTSMILAEDFGANYLATSTTINTVVDTALYDLPSDFYSLKYFRITLNGNRINIPKAQTDEIDIQSTASKWTDFASYPSYRLIQDQVRFIPTPSAVHEITLHYTHQAIAFEGADDSRIVNLSDDSDYLKARDDSEIEWIILNAAIMVKNDQEEDPSSLIFERNEIWDTLAQIIKNQDETAPARVRDNYSDFLRNEYDDWY